MKILNKLQERWHGIDYPFLIHSTVELYFSNIAKKNFLDLSGIKSGDVVALIGDFDPQSIFTFIMLIDKNVIINNFVLEYIFSRSLSHFVANRDLRKTKF